MNLKSVLAQLQKDYLASFPEKIMNLNELHKSGQIDDLRTEYHKLKGTGRTYGLPEVSQLGEALETLCDHPAHLAVAVPLSLSLLEKIRTSRTAGHAVKIEEEKEFRAVVDLVLSHRRSA